MLVATPTTSPASRLVLLRPRGVDSPWDLAGPDVAVAARKRNGDVRPTKMEISWEYTCIYSHMYICIFTYVYNYI